MRRARFFLLLLGLCWFSGHSAFLYAQDEDDEDEDYNDGIYREDDWGSEYMGNLYSKGDKAFVISLGVMFPTLFFDNNGNIVKEHNFTPPVGGSLGPLAYTYFFTPHFFLGGEVSFYFNYTLGANTIFIIPFGLRTGWQFVLRRFEIPLSLTVGLAPQRYLSDYSYWGLFLKGEASVFFRFNPDWSFGVNGSWNWYPQWTKEPEKDMHANIIGVTLAARYHF